MAEVLYWIQDWNESLQFLVVNITLHVWDYLELFTSFRENYSSVYIASILLTNI